MSKEKIAIKSRTSIILSLLLTTFLIGNATGIQRTVLSIYSKSLAKYAILAFLPIITFGIFKGTIDLVAGVLSDTAGRKRTMIIGILTYILGAVIIALNPTLLNLALGNILLGLGEGMVFASTMIALSDIYGTEESATSFGYMESFTYWGLGFGSVMAGFIWSLYTIELTFYYSLYSAIIGLVISLLLVRETKNLVKLEKRASYEGKQIKTLEAYKLCLKRPSLAVTYISGHIAKLSDALAWAAFPLLFLKQGYTSVDIGILQGVITFMWALSMPIWGKVSDRIGRKVIIFSGLSLKALSLLLLMHTQNFGETIFAASIVGLSYGMYYPILPAVSVDLAPLAAKGRALGLYRAIRDYGYFTGAMMIGFIVDSFNIDYAFYIMVLFVFSAAFLVLTIVRETRPAWPFFNLIVQHIDQIIDILRENMVFLEKLASGDYEEAEKIARHIKEIERQADRLKRRLMSRIWASALPFGDRMDFERLVELIDKMAGCILESHERLLRIRGNGSIEPIIRGIIELNQLTLDTALMFRENIEALQKSPIFAIRLADEVDYAETRVDKMRRKLLDRVRELLENKKIDILTAMDLRDTINLIEDVADDLEDASDIVRVISYKHSI